MRAPLREDLIGTLTHTSFLTAFPIQISTLDAQFCANAAKHHLPSLNPRDVIEIQGSSSSGKTHFLYLLLINCTIPHQHESTTLGGWGKVGITFDMDGGFSVTRFYQLLIGHLTRLLPSDKSTIRRIAQESLKRLHIFQPTSSTQLAATITHLAKYHTANSLETEIGLVAIDSISAHYWSDRFTAENMQPLSASLEHGKRIPGFTSSLQHILTALEVFRHSHGNITALTNWGLHPVTSIAVPMNYKQPLHPFPSHFPASRATASHLMNPSSLVNILETTWHITLSATPPSQSHNNTSFQAKEANRRQDEEFIALIRTPTSSTIRRFTFYIASNVIYVE